MTNNSSTKPRKPNTGQFKKGKSGNPRGRPRKPKVREMLPRIEDLHSVLSTEMLKEHEYKLNGESKSLPYVVLLLRTMKMEALKGDKTARKQLLEWWKDHLAKKYDDKMEFFQATRDADVLSHWDVLALNEKL